ncbi:MAG: hypothetical protein VB102_14355 [Paludibacter sp.]|nr:hypothetical protein [Paludibacter sp.]
MKKQTNEASTKDQGGWFSRNMIALIITGLVVGVTAFIAIFLLFSPMTGEDGETGFKENLAFIGQTLLPLWGTWIGTVLAFYFGKANFEAGTKSYQEGVKAALTPEEKIAQLAVKDVMLLLKDIIYLDIDSESPKLIGDILKYPQFESYNRFAVLDKNEVVKYMIHRSTFYQFIYLKYNEYNKNGAPTETDKLTLDDLLKCTDEKIKNTLTRGIGFVSYNANLLDAKRVIDATDECQDVFVTQNGKPSEPVLGLITNNRIFQYAKV